MRSLIVFFIHGHPITRRSRSHVAVSFSWDWALGPSQARQWWSVVAAIETDLNGMVV